MIRKTVVLLTLILGVWLLAGCESGPNIAIKYGFNDAKDVVRYNLSLDEFYKGETIVWTSSNEAVITSVGVVTRPNASASDVKVTLTAETSEGKKTFNLTVKKLTGDAVYDAYPSLNDQDHIVTEIDYQTTMGLFNPGQDAVLLMGWPTCGWCIEYIYYYNMLAKQQGIEEILYYNHRTIRNDITIDGDKVTLNAEFKALTDKIDPDFLDRHATDNTQMWIFSPTLFIIKDGVVVDALGGAIEGHNAYEASLTEAQKMILIFGISELYTTFKN
ncbi:MAG: hypothetical protein CVV63_00295 [Tenericutes bacterium HGW-Tenericutes-8]|nr:MAG: hypothetical protein CVV63_00295 [Tenericutes bacterium HGW-Tenericutes-8]